MLPECGTSRLIASFRAWSNEASMNTLRQNILGPFVLNALCLFP